ncbi:MAG TPA: alpha-2-macroglobulin [Pseudolabrys sp.]|uniref:alpha-2-macroglobulin family protein n=1 Tax=Pseudolabrys sp. TaxID=1960880 RepID=UPI002DDD2C06|nr:alpha-2-macroglobulin [Pseudolabrys sp.]HEV2627213.1 alpha-2-macroglobulin [Pseudolabrys sp.]
MLTLVRAGLAAALIAFAILPATAQDAKVKDFQLSRLDEAAVKLEAQIKSDAGKVTKPAAQLRKDADAAFQKNDFRAGMVVLGQLVAVAPDDGANWLRLARSIRQIKPRDDKEKAFLLDRAATSAYIGYLRGKDRTVEADSLTVLGDTLADQRQWRPALDAMRIALEARESADLRGRYERLRLEHGFRMLDYSVDSDAVSPRACFQFSELLPAKGTDFSPFVAVLGQDRPALSVNEKQLCVEGLKHGERYQITLRAGLPSTVHETLSKSTEFTIFVRDRKPFVRFSGKAYVLPRTGQRGIPVLSVNTSAVTVAVYRIGDRNLIDTVLGYDFQRNLSRYQAEQIASERGSKVWSGELKVEPKLNTEVTTAFPVGEALKDIGPGVYAMIATPKDALTDNDYDAQATQWFIVSDLGLTAYTAHDGVDVFVHSLASAEPKDKTEVRLIARNNEVLAVRQTDQFGHAHFEAGLTRGEGGQSPAAVVASEKADYAFLSLKAPAFDLSDRGVAGRPVPVGLDAFVYTERGVYRTGETVHITTLLRDARGAAALNVPLTLVVERPDGVDYRRALVSDQGLGGRALDVPLVSSAMTGTWRVRAYTDPKRPAIGETTFMVEDYVPDRVEFDLTSKATGISAQQPAEVSVDGHFLYGAPASQLDLSGDVTIAVASARAGFPGYAFGAADDDVQPVRQELSDLAATDETGKATFEVALDNVPDTSRPLEAKIAITMSESGGRGVERKLTLPVRPAAAMIGVKPAFSGRSLEDGANADFDVVMVAPDGKTLAQKGLHYALLKIETSYQWYRQNGQWEFEPIRRTEKVADGTLDVAADKPARLSLPVKWGRYRLEVSNGDAMMTSLGFDAGFYAESSADTPDLLELALDRPGYAGGDTMNVAVTARTAGRLTLNVFTDRLVASQSQDVPAGTANLKMVVGRDWGTGAYMVATLRRPLDAPAQRMPGRAIGVQWFSIDKAAHLLKVALKPAATMRPNATMTVPIEIGGLAPSEEARVVVAAVDVGILNLTNYKPPAPDDYYLGQRRLTAEIRDLYGQLIDGMQGARGAIRSGGDMGAAALSGSPPTQAPLALYSGIVTVGPDGKAQATFDIPAFAGTVRVMAVAWSKDKVGKASTDVVVRDPVVLTATLPRFLRTGDSGAVQLELDNVEGAAGDYSINVAADGPVAFTDGKPHVLMLAQKQRSRVSLPVSASGAGGGHVDVTVSGPNGFTLARSYDLDVRPANQILTRRTVAALAKGGTLTLDKSLFADFVPGTGRAALSVALSTSLDAASLFNALDRYPFGCSEQIASKAMAMLYLNELAGEARLAPDGEIETRLKDAIPRLLARQGSNGSFGLWSAGGEDVWLDAYVTDFLTRAREKGFDVPQTAYTLAVDRLRNYVATAPEPSKNGGRELAYALYVLARNGAAPIGDLRYYADTKLSDFATPIAKAQIAAALAMLGDRNRADRAYTAALDAIAPKPTPALDFGRTDFGSQLRDAAALVTLASEGRAPQATIDNAVLRIDASRQAFSATSTQEDAWLVLAARSLAKQLATISLDIDGQKRQGAYYRSFGPAALDRSFAIANAGEGTVQTVVSVSGAPVKPEPVAEHGFKIERKFYTLAGEPADPGKAKQNDRFVVVLTMTEMQPQFGRIIVADYLPAGFEIDNPHLVSSGDTGTLGWITNAAEPVHSEFRDDRFTAAFDRAHDSSPVFTVAYVVRAVSPGHYVLPQATVEDMYRPDRFARTGTGTIEVTSAK